MTNTVVVRKLIYHELDESAVTPRQKRMWALAACGIGLDGYDLFVMSAALPLIKNDFGINSAAMAGLLAGAAVLGAVPGAFISGILADRFGRRTILRLDVYAFAVSAVLCAIAWNPIALVVFRFMQGFAVGAEYPISASIVTETMPRKSRGRWVTGAFSFQAVGMVLAATVSTLILLGMQSDGAWRWMLLSSAVPAFLLGYLRRGVPESPRWLARKDRIDEALTSMGWLLGPKAVADVETKVAAASEVGGREPREGRTRELFGRSMRSRTALTAIPWFIMDIGLYGIGLFTPILLAGIFVSGHANSSFISDDLEATASSAATDIFLVIGFLLNILWVERLGRIRLQVIGFVGCAIGMMVVAFSHDGKSLGLVLIGFTLFNLFVNLGPNATTYLLPAEVFPTRLRSTGHGFAAACGKTGAAIGTFFLPVAVASFGLNKTMLTIGILLAAGAIITLLFRVETRGVALE